MGLLLELRALPSLVTRGGGVAWSRRHTTHINAGVKTLPPSVIGAFSTLERLAADEVPPSTVNARLRNKKKTGLTLDGRTWDEWPHSRKLFFNDQATTERAAA